MQSQLGQAHGPCALHLAPGAESPPEPAAHASPLPSVTPFRRPRGRAAQPSGPRSANFSKPDGDGEPSRAGWGSGRLAPLAPQVEKGESRQCFQIHHEGSELRAELRAAGSQSAASCTRPSVRRRWERAPALPGGRRTGGRSCVRASVPVRARGAWGCVCVEVCVGDKRAPEETSVSHRRREPARESS